MLQNPLIQTIMLFIGSYTVMSVLKKHEPFGTVVTVIAGLFTVIIWMLRYNRQQLSALYTNPAAKPVIDIVCKMTKEQPPVDGSLSAVASSRTPGGTSATAAVPARPRAPVSAKSYQQDAPAASGEASAGNGTQQATTPLLLQSPVDFSAAAHRLKEIIRGNDATIDAVMRQISQNLTLRKRGLSGANLPPIGSFLFVGRSGLGKRSLAVEIGRMIYSGDSVGVLDLAESGASVESIIASARSNPYQTFVIENIGSANQQTQNDLLTVLSGSSLIDSSNGARVSFRNCFFFFLVHKEAESFPKQAGGGPGTGMTMLVDHVVQTADLDHMLALGMHGIYGFEVPDEMEQAQVITLLMEQECRKYNLAIGAVDPAILVREVEEVSKLRSFRASPARISKLLSRPIHRAIAEEQETVSC